MNDYLDGQIEAYCYMVKNGKPAAMLPIQERYIDDAIEKVTSISNLNTFIEELSDGWRVLWIYNYPHIKEIIKSSQQAPDTLFNHWVLGKLFGYSEEAINEYLIRSGHI